METEKERKTREYSRVDAFIPFLVRPVSSDQRRNMRSRIAREPITIHHEPLPVLEDEALSKCLAIINNKLDVILNILNLQQSGINLLKSGNVNISGNGLSFDSEEYYAPEDLLEIKLTLPATPDLMFYIYGEVVRSEPGCCKQYRISTTFSIIDEDIREKIVKFVFERQREILRNQRRQ